MSIQRIIAVFVIYAIAYAGWFILANAMDSRSQSSHHNIDKEVQQLWGKPLVQSGPLFKIKHENPSMQHIVVPEQSRIQVDLRLDQRKKGLLWYPTFECAFASTYHVRNQLATDQVLQFSMPFPAIDGTYDAFSFTKDQQSVDLIIDTRAGLHHEFVLKPGQTVEFGVSYITRGIESWLYQINKDIGRVKDFSLMLTTNFINYDYVPGTMSADTVADRTVEEGGESREGKLLTWKTTDRITQQHIGLSMPHKLNPGPLSARMTYFAPVCLIFFFALVAAISIVRKINIHPMHFLFVAAGFFSFHLLFAYLVDLINVHFAFAISTATTLFLVTKYLSAALKGALPALAAIGGQLFFLVLFSYSFFLDGTTGLTVAIGSVITLAVVMRLTADVDWQEFFSRQPHLITKR